MFNAANDANDCQPVGHKPALAATQCPAKPETVHTSRKRGRDSPATVLAWLFAMTLSQLTPVAAPAPPGEGRATYVRSADDARIVGGLEIEAGAHPYLVSLTKGPWHYCAGTIISPIWVLTAAHCVDGYQNSGVHAGLHNLTPPGAEWQYRSPDQVIMHPGYDGDYSTPGHNDIAIIKLNQPLILGANIRPVSRLESAGTAELVGTMVTAVGWGRTSDGGSSPTAPLQISIPIVSDAVCRATMPVPNPLDDNMICAGIKKPGVGVCKGDSGGPLVYKNEESEETLVGIASWTVGCALFNKYDVYTEVSAFRDWICQTSGVGCPVPPTPPSPTPDPPPMPQRPPSPTPDPPAPMPQRPPPPTPDPPPMPQRPPSPTTDPPAWQPASCA